MAFGEYIIGGANVGAVYHFNGNANDSSGNARNATATNVSYDAGFLGSGSATLNGSNAYLNCGFIPQFGSASFFLSIKFKTSTSASNIWLLGQYNGTKIYGIIQDTNINGQNKIGFLLRDGNSVGYQSDASPAAINDGKQHEFTLIVDRSANKVYGIFDGSLTINNSITFTGSFTGTINCFIGAQNGPASYFTGNVDEAIIGYYAPTPSDAIRKYTSSKGRLVC